VTKNFPYLTHPFILSALIVTAINDHYLKYQFHNFLTGKISDFSGLFFFPLFLYALIEFIRSPLSLHSRIRKEHFVVVLFLTDILFVLFKYTFFRDYLAQMLNLQIIPDITDLAALSMNLATYFFAKKYFTAPA